MKFIPLAIDLESGIFIEKYFGSKYTQSYLCTPKNEPRSSKG